MSIRVTCLWVLIIACSVYAYRDWFRALCGLILLMAFTQHPDMPTNVFNVQGLNPWNILMFNILAAWAAARHREGLRWDMPGYFNVALAAFLAIVLIGFVRLMLNRSYIPAEMGPGYLFGEYLINTLKWIIPGLLLFDGCRRHDRLKWALFAILGLYLLLALQVVRWMPPTTALSVEDLAERSYKIIQNEIGYSRVNMSRILAGGSWATLACLPLVHKRWQKIGVVGLFFVVAYAQALTGGRMGYATWFVVGLILCLVRWRRYLLFIPVVLLLVVAALPGVRDRMLYGFGQSDVAGQTYVDDYQVTAGRSMIWPLVIDKIMESPVVGYGRQAMVRTGLSQKIWDELREAFAHPHNAYLEWMFDNGVIGLLLGLPLYLIVVVQAARLFLSRKSWESSIGGICLALSLALLVAGGGSQTFYPREAEVGLWASIGLMMRLRVERAKVRVPLPARGRRDSPLSPEAAVQPAPMA